MTMRRRPRVAAALLFAICVLAAVPGWAETHYFCYLKDPYSNRGYYFTPVMSASVDELDETQTGFAFGRYASANGLLTGGNSSVNTGCLASSNLEYVRENHARFPDHYPGIVLVDWPDPPVPSRPADSMPGGAVLVIEDAEPPVVPAEVMAVRALAEERRAAAARAQAQAMNAQRDAELNAMLQQAIERAKRRGRMQ